MSLWLRNFLSSLRKKLARDAKYYFPNSTSCLVHFDHHQKSKIRIIVLRIDNMHFAFATSPIVPPIAPVCEVEWNSNPVVVFEKLYRLPKFTMSNDMNRCLLLCTGCANFRTTRHPHCTTTMGTIADRYCWWDCTVTQSVCTYLSNLSVAVVQSTHTERYC